MDNKQYQVLKQPTRHLHIKLDLINDKNEIVDELTGFVIDGQLNIDATTAYRRSGNLTMVVTKKNDVIPKHGGKIWFDKRVGIHIGITNYLNEIVWFNMGRYAILDATISKSGIETTVVLSLSDYMCFLDGSLGGIIANEVKIIDKDVTINQAIKSIVTGLVDFSIENATYNGKDLKLPYKIEKLPNVTVYTLIQEIAGLYMGYEFYFDENGYFVFKRITDKKDDPIQWDFEKDDYKLNFQTKVDFTDIQNEIWVYGHTDNYGVQVKERFHNKGYVNGYSELFTLDVSKLKKGDIFFDLGSNKSYMYNGNNFTILEFNVDWRFCSNLIGRKKLVVSDNNIFDESQAKLRAEYELVHSSRFDEQVSFGCVPLFGLNVNEKVKIKSETNGDNANDYLIKKISVPLSYNGDMNIIAVRMYY